MTPRYRPASKPDPAGIAVVPSERSSMEVEMDSTRGLPHVLTLYVASLTPRSVTAIQAVKGVCEKYLPGRYDLDVIDIYEHPSLARSQQIVAAPTLIRELPPPPRRLIGDMADERRLLVGLDLARPDEGLVASS